jgi:hypothetical protein
MSFLAVYMIQLNIITQLSMFVYTFCIILRAIGRGRHAANRLEAPRKIGVIGKACLREDLADGQIGKGKQVFGVGKADAVQIRLEALPRLTEEKV